MKNIFILFIIILVQSCTLINEPTNLLKLKPEQFKYIFECTTGGQKVKRIVTSKVSLTHTELELLNNTIVEKYGYDYQSCHPEI